MKHATIQHLPLRGRAVAVDTYMDLVAGRSERPTVSGTGVKLCQLSNDIQSQRDAELSSAIREVRNHELNGVPLAERCELCGFHHGIGAACITPRTVSPGLMLQDEAAGDYVGNAAAKRVREAKAVRDAARAAERRRAMALAAKRSRGKSK